MALRLPLRRALTLSAALLSHTRLTTATTTTTIAAAALPRRHIQPRSFSSASMSVYNNDQMNPEVLFEGCDYRHWLIVMDFGKDPDQLPSPEQMVETYVQTCAKVLGSVEEAKRRIYACSTTTYTGFQVEVDEETSNKFEGLPGVIFILPDSYIDPVNKEYGGDKYINGEIIHRPPPVQYARTGRGIRPNYERPRDPMPNQQGNPGYNQHAPMPQDRRCFTPQGPQQGFPNQQGNPGYNQHAPVPQHSRGFTPQGLHQGFPNQQGNPAYNQHESMPQDRRGYTPQGPQQGFPQQQSIPSPQSFPPRQNYVPSGQADGGAFMPGATNNPALGRDGFQGGHNPDYNLRQGQMSNPPGTQGGYAQPGQSYAGDHAYNHPQGQRGNHPGDHSNYTPPGQMGFSGASRSTSPSSITGAYGQTGAGPFEQSGTGLFGQGPGGGDGHGAGYTPYGENQRFPPTSNEQSGTGLFGQGPGSGVGYRAGDTPLRIRPPTEEQSNILIEKLRVHTKRVMEQRNEGSPPTSNEQSNLMEHRNYPPGPQTGFNQQGRY